MRFLHRIGAVEQPILQRAVGRLAGGFEDGAVTPEQPAVIAAADALLADQAEFERGSAMRAMQLEEAGLAGAVTKGDEILAQDAEPERQVLQIVRVADRLPEAAEILAARRIRADMGKLGVFRRDLTVMIAAVTRLQIRSPRRHKKSPVHDRFRASTHF